MTMTRIKKKMKSDEVAEALLCLLLMYNCASLFVHMPSMLHLEFTPSSRSPPHRHRFRKGVEISKRGMADRDREIERRRGGEMGQSGVVNQPLKTQRGGNFL